MIPPDPFSLFLAALQHIAKADRSSSTDSHVVRLFSVNGACFEQPQGNFFNEEGELECRCFI
jgi:hypothetical protein